MVGEKNGIGISECIKCEDIYADINGYQSTYYILGSHSDRNRLIDISPFLNHHLVTSSVDIIAVVGIWMECPSKFHRSPTRQFAVVETLRGEAKWQVIRSLELHKVLIPLNSQMKLFLVIWRPSPNSNTGQSNRSQ
jgi:hypothetical protein